MSIATSSPSNRVPPAGMQGGQLVGTVATCLFAVGVNAGIGPVASMS
jgi:hypothetical protein